VSAAAGRSDATSVDVGRDGEVERGVGDVGRDGEVERGVGDVGRGGEVERDVRDVGHVGGRRGFGGGVPRVGDRGEVVTIASRA